VPLKEARQLLHLAIQLLARPAREPVERLEFDFELAWLLLVPPDTCDVAVHEQHRRDPALRAVGASVMDRVEECRVPARGADRPRVEGGEKARGVRRLDAGGRA